MIIGGEILIGFEVVKINPMHLHSRTSDYLHGLDQLHTVMPEGEKHWGCQ